VAVAARAAAATMTDARAGAHRAPAASAGAKAIASAGERPRDRAWRSSHPLLGAFPLAVMAFATFLIVFALMMARMTAGVDPAAPQGTATALVPGSRGQVAPRTRTSAGGLIPGTGPSNASAAVGTSLPTGQAVLATRTSGAAAAEELGDE